MDFGERFCLHFQSLFTINALAAADGVIIPVQTQKFACDGLSMFEEIFEQAKTLYNPKIKIIGVLPTMTDNTNVSKATSQQLAERYSDKVFSTSIHKSVEAANSTERMRSLCLNKTKLGEEYKSLASEVVLRCGNPDFT